MAITLKSGTISCAACAGSRGVARLGVQAHDLLDGFLQRLLVDLHALQDLVVVLLAEGVEVLVEDGLAASAVHGVGQALQLQQQAFAQVARANTPAGSSACTSAVPSPVLLFGASRSG
jgi:hypothetical protein